jgi:hypothetical protein
MLLENMTMAEKEEGNQIKQNSNEKCCKKSF